jgi:hypothetical protein
MSSLFTAPIRIDSIVPVNIGRLEKEVIQKNKRKRIARIPLQNANHLSKLQASPLKDFKRKNVAPSGSDV